MIRRPPILCTLLAFTFTLGLVGCGSKSEKNKSSATKNSLKKDNGKTLPPTKDKKKGASFLAKRPVKEEITTALRFVDRTTETGVSFTYRNGKEAGELTMLETLGGGVALVDYDLDGWPDIFATGGGTIGKDKSITGLPSVLYCNLGELQFAPVTDEANVGEVRRYSHGAYGMDYNSDGFPDLLVTGFGGLMLYENQGDGTFLDVTEQAGLSDTSWSVAAAWGDVNGDGVVTCCMFDAKSQICCPA